MVNILVVCVGNICRSPVAAALLQRALPDHRVASAGLGALSDHDIDATARQVAEARGIALPRHRARQFTTDIGAEHDLILVLEAGHKRAVAQTAPALSGRTFVLAHWTGQHDIPDPYQRNEAFHETVLTQMTEAVAAWAKRLSPPETR